MRARDGFAEAALGVARDEALRRQAEHACAIGAQAAWDVAREIEGDFDRVDAMLSVLTHAAPEARFDSTRALDEVTELLAELPGLSCESRIEDLENAEKALGVSNVRSRRLDLLARSRGADGPEGPPDKRRATDTDPAPQGRG